jgi:ribonuclease HI
MGLLLGLRRRPGTVGVREVEVFADSELMMRQLEGATRSRARRCGRCTRRRSSCLNDFERVKLVHVPREMNRAADEMSNRAIDERM